MTVKTVELRKPGYTPIRIRLSSPQPPRRTGDWYAAGAGAFALSKGIVDDGGGDLVGTDLAAAGQAAEVYFRLIGCTWQGGPSDGSAWLADEPIFLQPREDWTWHEVADRNWLGRLAGWFIGPGTGRARGVGASAMAAAFVMSSAAQGQVQSFEAAPEGQSVELGMGWNSATGLPTGTTICVRGVNKGADQARKWSNDYRSVSDVSDLLRSFDVSISAKTGSVGGAGVKGSAQLSTSTKVRTEDVVIAISVLGNYGADTMAPYPPDKPGNYKGKLALTEAAVKALEKGTFREECGDRFILAAQHMAGVRGVYVLNDVSKESHEAISSNFSAGTIASNVTVEQAMKTALVDKHRSVAIRYVRIGGDDVETAVDLDAFIKVTKDIGTTPFEKTRRERVTVQDYKGVAGYPNTLVPVAKDNRELMAEQYWRLSTLLEQVLAASASGRMRFLDETPEYNPAPPPATPITRASVKAVVEKLKTDKDALTLALQGCSAADAGAPIPKGKPKPACKWPDGVPHHDFGYREALPALYGQYRGVDYVKDRQDAYDATYRQWVNLHGHEGVSQANLDEVNKAITARQADLTARQNAPSYESARRDYWINPVLTARCAGDAGVPEVCPPNVLAQWVAEKPMYLLRSLAAQ